MELLKGEPAGSPVRIVRWIARIWSIASIAVIILFFIGERFDPSSLKWNEWAGFIFFPLGVSAGMIISWRREGAGGILAVGSLIAFYTVHLAVSGVFPGGWAWLAFSAPGFLFLFCRILSPGKPGRR